MSRIQIFLGVVGGLSRVPSDLQFKPDFRYGGYMPSVLQISYSATGGAGLAARNTSEAIERFTEWDPKFVAVHEGNLFSNPLGDVLGTMTASIDEFLIKKSKVSTPISLIRRSGINLDLLAETVSGFDAVHLHWVEGLLQGKFLEALRQVPRGSLFWTLHDMRPFTGCCHFSGTCEGYKTNCGKCPMVRKGFGHTVYKEFQDRSKVLRDLQPTFIAPGKWALKTFQASSLNELECILSPLPLSAQSYTQSITKPKRSKIKFGFVSANLADPRKGLDKARQKISELAGQGLELELEIVGSRSPTNLRPWEFSLGTLSSLVMPSWYESLDFLLFTSVSDNSPLVISEAFAAGTPVIVNGGTGADEMVTIGLDALQFHDFRITDLEHEMETRQLASNAKKSSVQNHPRAAAQALVKIYEDRIA